PPPFDGDKNTTSAGRISDERPRHRRVGRIGTRRSGTTAEHPRTLRRSPKGRPRYHCRPAPPRQTEALSSRTSRSRPLETSQPSDARAKTSVLRACRVPNPANRLNVVQRPKTLVEPSHWSQPPAGGVG